MNPLDSAPRFETQESEPVCRVESGAGIATPLYVCVDVALPRKGDEKKSSREWDIEAQTGYAPEEVTDVKYRGAPSTLRARGMRVLTHHFYRELGRRAVCIFSAIDATPKKAGVNALQSAYYRCTGIVASGIRIRDGARVSMLSHNDPEFFLKSRAKDFDRFLQERLSEFARECEPGTIDLAIIGGHPEAPVFQSQGDESVHQYDGSVSIVTDASRKILGISPLLVTIAAGRRSSYDDATEVFLDTRNNRLYVLTRPDGRFGDPASLEGTFKVERVPETFVSRRREE